MSLFGRPACIASVDVLCVCVRACGVVCVVCVCVRARVCACMHACVCVCACMHACVHACVHVCVCMYSCMCVCACMHACVRSKAVQIDSEDIMLVRFKQLHKCTRLHPFNAIITLSDCSVQ